MSDTVTDAIRRSYDTVAENYAAKYFGELEHKPLDRKLLDWLVEKCAALGPICDMGCGPGQVAAYVHSQGAAAIGIDLSPEMIRVARALNPGGNFAVGDMRRLDVPDESFGGIASFYSIIHIPRNDVQQAFNEFRRTLKPGGSALISCHIGTDDVHVDNFQESDVSFDGHFYMREEIRDMLTTAGFTVDEAIERDPYAAGEYPSRRLYVFARR
jgi:SAM-dependent methyltransferase